jgi:hypothetical protein
MQSNRPKGSKNHATGHSKYAKGSNNAAYLKAQQNQVAIRHLKQASQLSSESPKKGEERKASERSIKHGETAEYIKARLRRVHPEIAEQLEAGKFTPSRRRWQPALFAQSPEDQSKCDAGSARSECWAAADHHGYIAESFAC